MTVRIKLNNAGFRTLRTSDEAQELIGKIARRIAAACGPGYVAERSPSKNRARWTVYPETPEAVRDAAENLTLIRSLDAGRG